MMFAFECFVWIEVAVVAVVLWRVWITRNHNVDEPRGFWLCARCSRCSEDCHENGCPHGPCPMEFHIAD